MSGRYREKPDVECKVYVGDLPKDASDKELERSFSYYGPLKNVWVARNPPGFAFVEFEDPRDADDAIKGLDGTTICGVRARVEHSSGKVRPKPWQRGGRDGPRDGGRGSWGPSYGDRGGGGARRRRSNSRSRSRSYERTDRRRRSRSRSR